jgi:hypothetical protein
MTPPQTDLSSLRLDHQQAALDERSLLHLRLRYRPEAADWRIDRLAP